MNLWSGANPIAGRSVVTLNALLWLGLLVFATTANAHRVNESYVYFDVTKDSLGGRIEVTLTDLTRIKRGQEKVSESLDQAEVLADMDAFFDYFEKHLQLSFEDTPYQVEFEEITFFDTSVDTFAQLHFGIPGVETTPTTVQMYYDGVFSDIDPEHRGYALIASNARNGMDENEAYISLVFAPGDGTKDLYLNDEPSKDIARAFFERGVWHIWLGFDHILFLVTLLLGAVMRIDNQRWVPSESIRQSLWYMVKIVTLFTIANAIALCLATFEVITLPVPLVEAVIALSIVAVAIGNLVPRYHAQVWIAVVIFGISHGLGFATVLEPLGLDPERKMLGLATFNVGIEIGQLAIVLVLFPIFFALRRLPAYRTVALQFGSVALVAMAVLWFFERTVDWFPKFSQSVVMLVN